MYVCRLARARFGGPPVRLFRLRWRLRPMAVQLTASDRPIGARLGQKIDVFAVRDRGTDHVLPQPTQRKLMIERDQFRARLDRLSDEKIQKNLDAGVYTKS